jgi:hypothetical protein
MILADILMWFLIIVGLLAALISTWLAAHALFPRVVDRSREAYSRPIRAFLIGLAVAVPLLVVGATVASVANPLVKLAGIVVLGALILLGLVGSAGLSLRIGQGLPSPGDQGQPWRVLLRGGVVLALTFLLPFLGWFAVLPITLVTGVGAAASALRRRPEPPELLTNEA